MGLSGTVRLHNSEPDPAGTSEAICATFAKGRARANYGGWQIRWTETRECPAGHATHGRGLHALCKLALWAHEPLGFSIYLLKNRRYRRGTFKRNLASLAANGAAITVKPVRYVPINAAGSAGRCNSCAKFTRGSSKAQSFSGALVEAHCDFAELRFRVAGEISSLRQVLLSKLHVEGEKAALGTQRGVPCSLISVSGSIQRAAAMTRYLPAHRRRGAFQSFGNLTNRGTASQPA